MSDSIVILSFPIYQLCYVQQIDIIIIIIIPVSDVLWHKVGSVLLCVAATCYTDINMDRFNMVHYFWYVGADSANSVLVFFFTFHVILL